MTAKKQHFPNSHSKGSTYELTKMVTVAWEVLLFIVAFIG